jgi:hypothetical protein
MEPFITEEELQKYWRQSSSFRDYSIELNSRFVDKLYELLDDDALMIYTEMKPEMYKMLRRYVADKLSGELE